MTTAILNFTLSLLGALTPLWLAFALVWKRRRRHDDGPGGGGGGSPGPRPEDWRPRGPGAAVRRPHERPARRPAGCAPRRERGRRAGRRARPAA